MGRVYRAEDMKIRRRVTKKVLPDTDLPPQESDLILVENFR
jgi:hypothetical protein